MHQNQEKALLYHDIVYLSSNKNGGIAHFFILILVNEILLKTTEVTAKTQFVILAITSDGCSTVSPLLTKNLEIFVMSL